jgi:hypothetical protein
VGVLWVRAGGAARRAPGSHRARRT